MRYIAFAIAAAVTLSACQTQPGTVHDAHTGKTVVHSSRFAIQSGLLHYVHATAGFSNVNGYSVVIEHLAIGLGWRFFREAWSHGKRFQYVIGKEAVMGCSNGCSLYETGAIRMSERDFLQAAAIGFDFKLIGSGGSLEGRVPAEAFRQVLRQLGH